MSVNIFQTATTVAMAGVVIAALGTDIFSQTEVAGYAFGLLVAGGAGVVYSMVSGNQSRRSMAEPPEVSADE